MLPQEQKLEIIYKGEKQILTYFFRPGELGTVLWLHAYCCGKEDFEPAFSNHLLDGYTLAGFDFPGSSNSPYPENKSFDFDDLVEMTKIFIENLKLKNVIVIGHSTGSLVASLLAERYPDLAKAVVSVEGNMDLGDCWLTKKIAGNSYEKFIQEILPEYLKSLEGGPIEVYGAHLRRANPRSCYDYAGSVLKYSEKGLETFLGLKVPKLFIYCKENSSLSYLPILKKEINVVEIQDSNHWPIYDNPDAFFKALSEFLKSNIY
ncbi:MAG TPA: hypothetical protein DEB09_03935 [Candidatus Magasanikbacteria bacterium]|nr:hypothetical protein [Candidatus Magasanikbacteria bacterium]